MFLYIGCSEICEHVPWKTGLVMPRVTLFNIGCWLSRYVTQIRGNRSPVGMSSVIITILISGQKQVVLQLFYSQQWWLFEYLSRFCLLVYGPTENLLLPLFQNQRHHFHRLTWLPSKLISFGQNDGSSNRCFGEKTLKLTFKMMFKLLTMIHGFLLMR